jgi:pimeloyl-ACP methyl ester carboxylesterase
VTWQDCFGWIHHASSGAASDVVTVICPGVGRDSSTGYRAARFLADHLAFAGFPTLRFSYPGTGDSLDPTGEGWWAAWIRSVNAAIDMARAITGARRVVLIGVRLGAALAALRATEREDVAGLVLLEPVVRGSSFVTQLRIEEKVSTRGMAIEGNCVRIHGLHLIASDLAGIATVDLRALKLSADCSVLVLSDSTSAVLRSCEDSWRRQGTDVVHEGAEAMAAFFRPTHLADEPFPEVRELVGWVRSKFPTFAPIQPSRPPHNEPSLTGPGWTETPHRFGVDDHLFGIICTPQQQALCDTVVIIGNSGGDPHDGFARFGVEFARGLALSGIASFRMDFAGLGDSVNGADDRDGLTHTFTVDRRGDFTAAVDWVLARGFRKIALHGICSGAYHALQAAVDDVRIDILLCINLPWFSLRYERAGPASFAQQACANLAARGVRCLLLFAEDDSGLKPLEQHFGLAGKDLVAHPGFDVVIRPDIDHDLTRPEMRRVAADTMMMFLRQEPPAAEPATLEDRHLIPEGVL